VKLGICVLNWNAGEMLTRCIEDLRFAARDFAVEMVVVDNDSRDASISRLLSTFPGIRVIRNSCNLGYARGNNVGAGYLCFQRCDYLLFINPDVLISDTSLTALVESLGQCEAAGAAGGLPKNADGISRMAARTKPSPLEKLVLYGPLHRLPFLGRLGCRHFLDWRNVKEGEPVYAICGACILFRSGAFEDAGGFDESTFLYEEELIMSERLRSAGLFFILSKNCVYFHAEALSTRRIPYKRRFHFITSEQYLIRAYYRWGFVLRLVFRFLRYLEWVNYALTLSFRPKARSESFANWPPTSPGTVARRGP
jgi:GT2 family glycosyltransferase